MVNQKTKTRDTGRKTGYTYTPRDPRVVKERAEQTGGTFDSIFKQGVDTWKPKQGDNTIRILPPTWEGAEYYGYDVFVHSYVGVDKSTYLCLDKMKGKRCPICEAAKEAKRAGEDQDAKEMSVRKQTLVYLLDRDEGDQPLVWSMSWTMDRDIATLCQDKRTGKVLQIDHPDDGYDVTFKRQGTTKTNTKYFGLVVDRERSPILESVKKQDALMAQIEDAPLPSLLKFYDEEHLEKIMSGTAEKEDPEMEERGSRRRGRDEPEEEETPRRRVRGEPADEPEEETPRRRARGDAEEEEPAPRTRVRRDDPEEEAPRRRRADPEEEEPAPRRRGRAEEEEEPAPRRRGREEAEEEPAPRRRAARDEEEEPAPRRRAARDEEEEPAPRRRREESEEEEPRRRRADPEEEEPAPRRRGAAREEEAEEPAPRRRVAREEEAEEPAPRTRVRRD